MSNTFIEGRFKGIGPDPMKVREIDEFSMPQIREDHQRFLSMVTYLAKFTPHSSSLKHSLHHLLNQETSGYAIKRHEARNSLRF